MVDFYIKEIQSISQKMLTVTLRTLEEDGLVVRRAYPTIPPKVEYSLSERARSFMKNLQPLVAWAIENMPAIIEDRKRHQGVAAS